MGSVKRKIVWEGVTVHLLDKTLILSKPAVHCGEESAEDNLPKERGNNVKRKSEEEEKETNRAQEKQYNSQSMLPQVQPIQSETIIMGLEKGILGWKKATLEKVRLATLKNSKISPGTT